MVLCMDPVSHALLGASWSQSHRVEKFGTAALLGGLSALAPDLDALIQSSNDPLLLLEYHRQFTHSLAFVPFGALLCALVFFGFARRRLTFPATYGFCFLGFASHCLLDACTTYGTELLWPFSDARIAWSIVSAIDPAFTLPLLALVVLAVRRKTPRYAYFAAAWATVYLAFGALQQARAEAAGAAMAGSRGHVPVRLEAKPALGSVLLWKVIYEHDGRYYVDAARVGFAATVDAGESIAKLDVARHLPWLDPHTQQSIDVERFRRVSDGFLGIDTTAPNRIVDLRYSMVPNEIAGFWAIILDPDARQDDHVEFVTTTQGVSARVMRLLDSLLGTEE
jgi:inner membrane protein